MMRKKLRKVMVIPLYLMLMQLWRKNSKKKVLYLFVNFFVFSLESLVLCIEEKAAKKKPDKKDKKKKGGGAIRFRLVCF